jgi:hypothetical protein
MTGSVKPIALLRRHFRKLMGFAAAQPSYGLQEPVERRIGQRGNHFQFAPPLDLQMDQSAFPAASRLRPRGGGLRRRLSSARA